MRFCSWRRLAALLLILPALFITTAGLALHLGLQRFQLALDRIEGPAFGRDAVSLSGLSVRYRSCLTLHADRLRLGRQSGRWQLSMTRLQIDDQCPPPTEPSQPSAILEAVLTLAARPGPALTLEIGQLRWADAPPLSLALSRRASQWQLEVKQPSLGRLAIDWHAGSESCRLQAETSRLSLVLAGRCTAAGRLELTGPLTMTPLALALSLTGTPDTLSLGFHTPAAAPLSIRGQANLELARRALTLAADLRQGERQGKLALRASSDQAANLGGQISLQLAQTGSLPLEAELQGELAGQLAFPLLRLGPSSRLHLEPPGLGALELRPAGPLRLEYRAGMLQLAGDTRWQTGRGSGNLGLALAADLAAGAWQGELHLAGDYALGEAGRLTLDNRLLLEGPLAAPLLRLPAGSQLRLTQLALGPWRAAESALRLEAPLPLPLAGPIETASSWLLEPLASNWNGRPLPILAGRLTLSPGVPLWRADARLTLGDSPLRLEAEFDSRQARLRLHPTRLPLVPLLPLLVEDLQSVSGQLALEGELRWQAGQPLRWQANGQVEQFSGRWQESLLAQINGGFRAEGSPTPIRAQGFVEFAELNAGIALTQGLANWQLDWQKNQPGLRLSRLQARLLGGILTAERLHYPAGPQADPLHLSGLSLAALSQLQQEPTVRLEGRLAAELPVRLTPEGMEIRAGRLQNQGQASLELLPSPGLESWLDRQPQLAQVGDYLRQMTVQQLDARLDLSPAGLLQLDARLDGRSRGRSRQPLRLNYHHEENLLELLASLRMSDRFSQAIERHLQGNPRGESRP